MLITRPFVCMVFSLTIKCFRVVITELFIFKIRVFYYRMHLLDKVYILRIGKSPEITYKIKSLCLGIRFSKNTKYVALKYMYAILPQKLYWLFIHLIVCVEQFFCAWLGIHICPRLEWSLFSGSLKLEKSQ